MKSGQLRDLRRMVEAEGLVLTDTSRTGGDHLRLTVKRGDGVSRHVILSTTPGDRRSDLNSRAELRRFAKAAAPPPPPPPAAPRPVLAAPAPKPVAAPIEPPAEPAPPPAAEPQRPPVEPARQEITVKPSPAGRAVNKLTQVEFFKLCSWIQAASLDGAYTHTEVAKRASAALGFSVSMHNIIPALEATGVTLSERPAGARGDRTAVVARELARLLRELGKEPPADLVAVATRSPLSAN